MGKIKLIVSICVSIALSGVGINGISKIGHANKAEIPQVVSEQTTSNEANIAKEEVAKVEEKLDTNNIENKETHNKEVATETPKSVEEGVTAETKENVEKPVSKVEEVKQPVQNKPVTTYTEPNKVAAPSSSEANSNMIAEIEQAIFTRVNAERAANGLAALSYNNTMQNYARIKSKDMGDRKYFDHKNPEGELITAQMKRDGVSYNAWGENIAYIQGNYSNASLGDQFMTNWMNSPGHRANILSGNFASIGVGVYKIGNTYYATQEFYK